MKNISLGVLLMIGVLLSPRAHAFYDASCETHAVVTNVMGFGAVADGETSDTDAIQKAVDYVSATGGGDLYFPYDSDGYFFRGIDLKSNVHIHIAAGTALILDGDPGGSLFSCGSDVLTTNVSIRGEGGRFKAVLPVAGNKAGTRFISLQNVFNFMLSDVDIQAAKENYSGIVFGVSGFDQSKDHYPTQGTIANASITNAHFGYGLVQVQAADTVLFTNLTAYGGVALRLETGWDKMNIEQFGGAHNIVGKNIRAYNGHGAVLLGAHSMQNGKVRIDGVYSSNCTFTAQCGGEGYVNEKVGAANPDVLPGSWAAGSYVRDVTCVFGLTAQLKSKNLSDVPDDLKEYIQDGVDGDGISLGPSTSAAGNGSFGEVEFSDVKAIGFDYVPPILTDSDHEYGITEDEFTNPDYATNLSGLFWSVRTNLNAGGTNWLSGNGAVGVLDMTTAQGNHHALNAWGFALQADSEAEVRSDFRYYHQPGEDLVSGLNEAAFGLLLSTDPDWSAGVNRFCLLANRGCGLGLIGDDTGMVAHTSLNVDTSVGGWSDWFQLKWMIRRGEAAYQGTVSIYDSATNLLYLSPTVDLGIENGTKLWAGYTTGTNGSGAVVSSFSGIGEVQLDQFRFEKSFVNEAPVWVEDPIRKVTKVDVPYLFNIRGFAHEPNDTFMKYYKLSGPGWLSLDEKGWLSGTPESDDLGDNLFRVKIVDPAGLSDTASFILTVSPSVGGAYSLDAAADTYVLDTALSNNFAAERSISLEENSREAFMRFDLSFLNGLAVTNARLRVRAAGGEVGMTHHVWFVEDDSWMESDVVWTNKPAIDQEISSVASPASDWWLELDLTDEVRRELAADQSLSIGLISEGGGRSSYHSREGLPGDRPELVVDTLVPSRWADYVLEHGLSGIDSNDQDGDQLTDRGEYVFGGNPTNSADQGVLPVFDAASSNYVFSLIGENTVVAHVLITEDLVDGEWWTNGTVRVTATDGVPGAYTNRVDLSSDTLFIKLQLEP